MLSVNLNNVNLANTNYQEDDPDITILIKLLACYGKFEKRKEKLKKVLNQELMPLEWSPNGWWKFCMSEVEQKDIEPTYICTF